MNPQKRKITRVRRPRKSQSSIGIISAITTLVLVGGIAYFVLRKSGSDGSEKQAENTEEDGPSWKRYEKYLPKGGTTTPPEEVRPEQPAVAMEPAAPAMEEDAGDIADARKAKEDKPGAPAVELKNGRSWGDTRGHTTVAELVSADQNIVSLRKEDGSVIKVKLSLLSDADREYVATWRKAQTASVTTPAPEPRPLPLMGGAAKEGEPAGFDAVWPTSVYVPEELGIKVITEDDSDRDYIYESAHFRFSCDAQLRTRLINECAKVFEATHEFLRLLPLNNQGTKSGAKKWPVYIFVNYSDYTKAGGPRGSAGVCISSGDESKVLVPLESFGVRKTGKDYTVESGDRDYKVLSHEITHQLMQHNVKQASWYIEGSAEYVAFTPYTGGRYKVAVNKKDIVASVTAYGRKNTGGRALGKEFTMPHLKEFMQLPYDEFTANANFNYGVACLMTYYWYHQDGKGEGERIRRYLAALQAKERESAARDKYLLDGRSWEQLEDDFRKGMRSFGVRVEFR